MKTNLALPLLFVGVLSGANPVSLASAATSEENCPLTGPLSDASQNCEDIRAAFWAEVRVCMGLKQSEADNRAGKPTEGNSHTYRARQYVCSAETRDRQGLASN